MTALALDPIWLQASIDAINEFDYGDIITHEWIAAHLGVEYPTKPMTLEEYKARDFDLLRKVEGFKDELLVTHKWYLVNVRGTGYQVVKPKHQTKTAMLQMEKDLRKAVSKTLCALVHINETALSLEDARENAESKAKVAALRTMHLKQLNKH